MCIGFETWKSAPPRTTPADSDGTENCVPCEPADTIEFHPRQEQLVGLLACHLAWSYLVKPVVQYARENVAR